MLATVIFSHKAIAWCRPCAYRKRAKGGMAAGEEHEWPSISGYDAFCTSNIACFSVPCAAAPAEPTMMSKEARQLMMSGLGVKGLELWKVRLL
eukprot:scaffold29534_cov19-Tisochrysis_lutea.AAC.2